MDSWNMTTARYQALSPTGPRMDTYVYRQSVGRAGRHVRPQSYHGAGEHAAVREHEWNELEQGRLHSILQNLRRRQRTSRGTRSLDREVPKFLGATGDHNADNGAGVGREEARVPSTSSAQQPQVHSRSSESLTSTTDSCSELLGGTSGGKTESGNGRRLQVGRTGSKATKHHSNSHPTIHAEEEHTPQMEFQGDRGLEGVSSNRPAANVEHRDSQQTVHNASQQVSSQSTRSGLLTSGQQSSDDDVSLLSL